MKITIRTLEQFDPFAYECSEEFDHCVVSIFIIVCCKFESSVSSVIIACLWVVWSWCIVNCVAEVVQIKSISELDPCT